MVLETLGHATILIRDDSGRPLFFTDPWLVGSCYWRSWWLQHYPADETVAELATAPFCYITHQHPDHFHTASIRRLGNRITYLCPALVRNNISSYLAGNGFSAQTLPPLRWV